MIRREVIGVFGAGGFIGQNIVRHLLGRGRRTIAFGRSFPANYEALVGGSVETRSLDFSDVLSTHAALQEVTKVIDLVNSSSPGIGNSHLVPDIESNVIPHVAFAESCLSSGIDKLVFLSSGGTVYGDPHYLPIDELHPIKPINSYGLTKTIVEQYLSMIFEKKDISIYVLRVSNPFGPGQVLKRGQGLIAAILRAYLDRQPVSIYGDGSLTRDYLYVDDLCRAMTGAIDGPSIQTTLNIGSGVGRSVLDVVAAVEGVLGEKIALEFLPSRLSDAAANVLDCRRAHEVIGWSATTAFEEALEKTVKSWTGAGLGF